MADEPATAISGPLHFSRDPITWLAEAAADRLRALRQHVHDLHSLIPPFEERHAATTERVEAEQRLKRLKAHASQGGFGLKDDDVRVQDAARRLDELAAAETRIKALDETRSAAWTAASHTLSAVQDWLRDGRPPGTTLLDQEGSPPALNKGETLLDAVERHRRRVRELKADLHRIRSAPFPSSHAKAQMRQQIEELAARGAPSVSHLLEHDRQIEFPTLLQRSEVHNTEKPAVAFAEVPDVLALTCWLHKPALIAALDREIDGESDDASALTHEARQRQEAVMLGDQLAVERDESALIWTALSQNLPVFHRNDCSPLAILQCALVTAPVSAASGSSRGHVFDLRR